MKIRSFTINLLIVSIVFSMNLISCGTLPISPTLTPSPTQTSTPINTPTPTETPTSTPIPKYSKEQLSQMTNEEKLAAAPDVDGYTKHVSGAWVIYENAEGPEQTYNLTTGAMTEIKQFPVCGIENFRDCPVTLEDIFNGNVMRWLEAQKRPFDTSKIKNVPLIWYEGWDRIQYDTRTAPNFTDPATDQQHRDIAMHLQNVVDGVTYDYIYLPVDVYDPLTKESHWV